MKHLDFDALQKAFTGLLWSAPYQCVCPYHTPLVAAVALSTHEGHQSSGPPVCVVSWCLLGSVTSCSPDHFWFWADSGKWPGLKKMFSLLPGAPRAVPWCPGLSHGGQTPSSVGFSPIWCHRQTDFTQFLEEMVFQKRSGKDLKLLGMLFYSAKHQLH